MGRGARTQQMVTAGLEGLLGEQASSARPGWLREHPLDLQERLLERWIISGTQINAHLRGEDPSEWGPLPSDFDPEGDAQRLTALMAPLPEARTLFRGVTGLHDLVGLSRGCLDSELIGSCWSDSGFGSSATTQQAAVPFISDALLVIEVEAGHPHIDLQARNDQKEILLGRDTNYKIQSVEQTTTDGHVHLRVIVQAFTD